MFVQFGCIWVNKNVQTVLKVFVTTEQTVRRRLLLKKDKRLIFQTFTSLWKKYSSLYFAFRKNKTKKQMCSQAVALD